jgi:hypothetical protein
MGLFTHYTESDALAQIAAINREMRQISASIHLNYNMIDGRNRNTVRQSLSNIRSYIAKYEKIKRNLSEYERIMFLGATVDVWNGERVGVIMWETHLQNTVSQLNNEVNY